MSTNILFEKVKLGSLDLKNRIIMPPMTRSRASKGDIANAMMAEYYGLRADAGLIISEGTQISAEGQGYAWTPGIYNKQQIAGWKLSTDAVHKNGGVIFAQIWHVGRISHTSLQPDGKAPVSSSELVADGVKVFASNGNEASSGVGEMLQHSKPRALTSAEVKERVKQFAQAGKNAIEAGFDGIEVHAANGYLINQFIDSEANTRTDEYGGSLENRLRFLDETVTALVNAIGKDKIGVRLAPLTTLNGTTDANPIETYIEACKLLNKHDIAYVHIAAADWDDAPDMPVSFKQQLRDAFKNTIIYAGKYTPETASKEVEEGYADLIGFGRPFIANPDLVTKIKNNTPFKDGDSTKYFGGERAGYLDY